jgi:FKBP-type peptidyl-prolyl cis-trans isomerase 2
MILKYVIAGAILMLVLVSGCSKDDGRNETVKAVKPGSVVHFDYAAGFQNGTIFDTSFENVAREAGIYDSGRDYKPERAVVGKDPLIQGLYEELIGMKVGETKNIRIPPEKAYGRKIVNSTNILPKSAFDNPETLVQNQLVVIATPEGDNFPVYIKELNAENVTIDQNHPLAGQLIQFSVVVRSIE